ncbi:hypothetical protein DPEC_G00144000 [Dallia pectoralis]|uniref:Uncharacterized protein n=1 Tax=Dallia pectoralis TaxID=75939 RepID=A0ACC2GND3_DALPE|nr:hypothetical protein DPEC_G00144000 [Dallia pectoralis]
MLDILLFGYLITCVSGQGGADVVLPCSLVEEGSGMGEMGGGALFSRTPATLVLRDLAVTPDLSPDTLTPFKPPDVPDPNDIILEAEVTSPEIPEAGQLLHADCNDQHVNCEISQYHPREAKEGTTERAYFIVSLQIEGGGLSLTLVLQTKSVNMDQSDHPTLIQSKLALPLSQSGTLLTEVVFVVFSGLQSQSAPLQGDALLDCGFRQQAGPPGKQVALEWRLQHRGHGRKVLEMKAGQPELESGPEVHVEREGSSVDAEQLIGTGNASLTLTRLKVSDQGTYICTVSAGLYQAQQVVQLHVIQPPHVFLSEDKLILRDKLKLSCHCKNYYPLDVQIEWLSLSQTDSEPIVISDHSDPYSPGHSPHPQPDCRGSSSRFLLDGPGFFGGNHSVLLPSDEIRLLRCGISSLCTL